MFIIQQILDEVHTLLYSISLTKSRLFPTSKLLRYNQQSDFTTATGGFVSLIVIAIMFYLFYSMTLKTINKQIINASISIENQSDPSTVTITASPDGGFMFSLAIYKLNLNDPAIRYFDFVATQYFFSPIYKQINKTVIPLVPCTHDHWNFNQDLLLDYVNLQANTALCPPLGYNFTVGGTEISQVFSQFIVSVQRCNSTLNHLCANDTMFQQLQTSFGGRFTLQVPLINNLVNAGKKDYIQTYLEGRNYFYFTSQATIEVTAQIQEYEINTDISLLPYQDNVVENYISVPNLFNEKSASYPTNSYYAQVIFKKSTQSTTFTRSYNKYDALFSYIGGLVGIILLAFFFISTYSEKMYVLSLTSELYQDQKSEQALSSQQFNFFYYLGLTAKKILNLINFYPKWEMLQKFDVSLEEMEEQINISYLIQRIVFLENAISTILSDHQFEALYLKQKRSIAIAQEHRIKHSITNKIFSIDKPQVDTGQKSKQYFGDEQLKKQYSQFKACQQKIQTENKGDPSDYSRLKSTVIEIIKDSKKGDLISRRILQKFNRNILHRLGIELHQYQNDNHNQQLEDFEEHQNKDAQEINIPKDLAQNKWSQENDDDDKIRKILTPRRLSISRNAVSDDSINKKSENSISDLCGKQQIFFEQIYK